MLHAIKRASMPSLNNLPVELLSTIMSHIDDAASLYNLLITAPNALRLFGGDGTIQLLMKMIVLTGERPKASSSVTLLAAPAPAICNDFITDPIRQLHTLSLATTGAETLTKICLERCSLNFFRTYGQLCRDQIQVIKTWADVMFVPRIRPKIPPPGQQNLSTPHVPGFLRQFTPSEKLRVRRPLWRLLLCYNLLDHQNVSVSSPAYEDYYCNYEASIRRSLDHVLSWELDKIRCVHVFLKDRQFSCKASTLTFNENHDKIMSSILDGYLAPPFANALRQPGRHSLTCCFDDSTSRPTAGWVFATSLGPHMLYSIENDDLSKWLKMGVTIWDRRLYVDRGLIFSDPTEVGLSTSFEELRTNEIMYGLPVSSHTHLFIERRHYYLMFALLHEYAGICLYF